MAETVKIEKDVYVRDQYGVRWRPFVAGTEVDKLKYDEIFRLNVPVNPDDLPKEPEFIGTEETNGKILTENKSLFSVSTETVKEAGDEPAEEADVVEDKAPKDKKGKSK